MLEAGRPERAALYLEAARSKGLRGGPLEGAVNDALDESNATRKEARAIEDGLAAKASEFAQNRLRLLAVTGLGVAEDGRHRHGSARPESSCIGWRQGCRLRSRPDRVPRRHGTEQRGRERVALPRARPLRYAVMSSLAQDHAAAMIADPDWDFVANPASAIGHASVSAAQSWKESNGPASRFWTEVAMRLVSAAKANGAKVDNGAVVLGLATTFGMTIPSEATGPTRPRSVRLVDERPRSGTRRHRSAKGMPTQSRGVSSTSTRVAGPPFVHNRRRNPGTNGGVVSASNARPPRSAGRPTNAIHESGGQSSSSVV